MDESEIVTTDAMLQIRVLVPRIPVCGKSSLVEARCKVLENTWCRPARGNVFASLFVRDRGSHDWKPGSGSDFKGLLKGLPLLTIKTQVSRKVPEQAAYCSNK